MPGSVSVHPRSRGEHAMLPSLTSWRYGSSPLARGTRYTFRPVSRCGRFIPARAGNTYIYFAPWPPSTVHPRSRGEHSEPLPGLDFGIGSSPLARGTHRRRHRAARPRRFIPARAGNTEWPGRHRASPAVHPRSRGEHPGSGVRSHLVDGSSPLARGTQVEIWTV